MTCTLLELSGSSSPGSAHVLFLFLICVREELGEAFTYLQAFCIFCWATDYPPCRWSHSFCSNNMAPWWRYTEFCCKGMEPQGLPSGLSSAAEVYFAGPHFKHFGCMCEGKSVTQPASALASPVLAIDLQPSPSCLRLCRYQLHVMDGAQGPALRALFLVKMSFILAQRRVLPGDLWTST